MEKLHRNIDFNFMYVPPYEIQRKTHTSNLYFCINFQNMADYALIKINLAAANRG